MPARAASDPRFPTKRRKRPYTSARTLLLLGIAALGVLVVFTVARGGGAGPDRVLSYRGVQYSGTAVATQADLTQAELVASGDTIGGQPAFVERRTPSRVVFLLRPDGRYDVLALVEDGP